MKFQSLSKWINEQTEEGITVIYPGGFKPMTGGHLDLISKYANNPRVKKVKVIVGPGVRNGIDQDTAMQITKILTKWMPNVQVEASQYPSPILTAYKFIENAPDGTYALAASSKGDDYKRVKSFTEQHQKGGKYYDKKPPMVNVVELPLDVSPKVFKGRTDENEGQPISASTLRRDILNNDKTNFAKGYPELDQGSIDEVWNLLQGIVSEQFVGTMSSGLSNYENIDDDDRYSSHILTPLEEGGGAGHMKNVWEATELTFKDLRDLINKSLSGELENITEKLDGQNLMVTWKDGGLYAARNKGHLKNKGETSLSIAGMRDFFAGRGEIEKAFVGAMEDLEDALKQSGLNLEKIFKNGQNWFNLEVLYPETENVVPYGDAQLRIHHIRKVDDEGNTIDVSHDNLDNIDAAISRVQNKEDKNFFIRRTNPVTIDQIRDSRNIGEGLVRQLQKIQVDNNVDDNETIQDYIDENLRNYIGNAFNSMGKSIDTGLIEAFIQRWGHGVKSPNIAALLKGVDPDIANWFKSEDKVINKTIKKMIAPVERIFLQLGATVLNNLKGLAASDPSKTSQSIKTKVEKAIKELRAEISKGNAGDPERIDKISEFLGIQLERLEQAGGIDAIAPTEGIVFDYNGQLLKLTGNFGPVNQLIGYLKFGR